jgi:hypothetical protein
LIALGLIGTNLPLAPVQTRIRVKLATADKGHLIQAKLLTILAFVLTIHAGLGRLRAPGVLPATLNLRPFIAGILVILTADTIAPIIFADKIAIGAVVRATALATSGREITSGALGTWKSPSPFQARVAVPFSAFEVVILVLTLALAPIALVLAASHARPSFLLTDHAAGALSGLAKLSATITVPVLTHAVGCRALTNCCPPRTFSDAGTAAAAGAWIALLVGRTLAHGAPFLTPVIVEVAAFDETDVVILAAALPCMALILALRHAAGSLTNSTAETLAATPTASVRAALPVSTVRRAGLTASFHAGLPRRTSLGSDPFRATVAITVLTTDDAGTGADADPELAFVHATTHTVACQIAVLPLGAIAAITVAAVRSAQTARAAWNAARHTFLQFGIAELILGAVNSGAKIAAQRLRIG